MAAKNITEVNLIDGYFLEIDQLNFTLKQRYIGETKEGAHKEAVRTIGYYGDMKHCVEALFKIEQANYTNGQELSIRRYVSMIEQSNKRVLNELKETLNKFSTL